MLFKESCNCCIISTIVQVEKQRMSSAFELRNFSGNFGAEILNKLNSLENALKRRLHLNFTLLKLTQLLAHDKWVPVTRAWRVLWLRMEERPPIWRVPANILNKQSRTTDKGWYSSLGFGRGANNSLP